MIRTAFLFFAVATGCSLSGVAQGAPVKAASKTAALERALDRANKGNLKPMHALLDRGLSPRMHLQGSPLLHFAATVHGPELARLLLARGARLDDRDADQNDALCIAALLGNAPVARVLLAAGADANSHNKDGDTPLHLATLVNAQAISSSGSADIARVLIAGHAQVNSRNKGGETPLHLAIGGQNFAIAKVLLQAGANPNARDKAGVTPTEVGKTWETMVLVATTSGKRKLTPSELADLKGWQSIKPLLGLNAAAPSKAASEFEHQVADLKSAPDVNTRYNAAEWLGKSHDPRALMPLLAAFSDKQWTVAEGAMLAVGELWQGTPTVRAQGSSPIVAALQKLGASKNETLRADAVQTLSDLGDAQSLTAARAFLKDASPLVRAEAITCAADHKDRAALAELRTIAQSDHAPAKNTTLSQLAAHAIAAIEMP
ncbi:hypothetical protein IAD21_05036 [Abditibacteriota bacterium]|nr:hypothetical protein IAD21_05036 [Abditibacteriota bacterium]